MRLQSYDSANTTGHQCPLVPIYSWGYHGLRVILVPSVFAKIATRIDTTKTASIDVEDRCLLALRHSLVDSSRCSFVVHSVKYFYHAVEVLTLHGELAIDSTGEMPRRHSRVDETCVDRSIAMARVLIAACMLSSVHLLLVHTSSLLFSLLPSSLSPLP
jgi:hypothetical protein